MFHCADMSSRNICISTSVPDIYWPAIFFPFFCWKTSPVPSAAAAPLLAAGNWQHEGNFYAIIASEKWLFTVNKTLGTLLPPPPDSQCLKLHFIFRVSLLSFTIYIWTLLLVLMMSRWDQRKGDILSKHKIFLCPSFFRISPNIDNDCFKSLGIFGVGFNYPHFRLVSGQLFLKDSYSILIDASVF